MSCEECSTYTVENLPAPISYTAYIGDTFNETITWQSPAYINVDLTGYTAAMKVKNGSETVISLTETDGITLGGTAGTIHIYISNEDTAALTSENCNYDLALTSPGDPSETTTLIAGPFYIRQSITNG